VLALTVQGAVHRRADAPPRAELLKAATEFWNAYRHASGGLARQPVLEARGVRHTLGCLLSRVDGRSPLEYLTETARDRQRATVLALMQKPPATLPALIQAFGAKLNQ